MDDTRIIRGRTVVFERREPVETLCYSLDVFDAGDNLIEVLGRLADLSVAQTGSTPPSRSIPTNASVCARCAA